MQSPGFDPQSERKGGKGIGEEGWEECGGGRERVGKGKAMKGRRGGKGEKGEGKGKRKGNGRTDRILDK